MPNLSLKVFEKWETSLKPQSYAISVVLKSVELNNSIDLSSFLSLKNVAGDALYDFLKSRLKVERLLLVNCANSSIVILE